MNTANNQRFQETDRKIRQSMLTLLQTNSLDKITVGELCRMTGCNRSTFYAHFLDVYDLMDKIQLEIYQDMRAQFSSVAFQQADMIRPQLLTILLTPIRQNSMFYHAYLSSGRAVHAQLEQQLYQHFFRPYFEQLGFDFHNEADTRRAFYHFRFFYTGMISVIREWLAAGCPETPEQLTSIIWESIAPVPPQT